MGTFDTYDETKAHEIVGGIHWVGFDDIFLLKQRHITYHC